MSTTPALPVADHWSAGRRVRRKLARLVRYALVLLALAFTLLPIWWVAIAAFKTPVDLFHIPPIWIPREPTLDHFKSVMPQRGFVALRNSTIIATAATTLAIALGCPAAYALARFGTGGRHFSFWLLSQRMMPPVVLIIPLFLLIKTVGLVDSHAGLIILYTVFNLPFVVWMLRGYFLEVPAEVEESAMVDGTGRLGALWWITLPLALPGLIATATFAFIFNWSEFLFALILTRNNAYTLPVVISGYTFGQGAQMGSAAALALVASLPVVVIGMLVHRHFVRGFTLGSVRG